MKLVSRNKASNTHTDIQCWAGYSRSIFWDRMHTESLAVVGTLLSDDLFVCRPDVRNNEDEWTRLSGHDAPFAWPGSFVSTMQRFTLHDTTHN